MLKTAFRRCHNYIHGNEGMPKDKAFWQFLYLLFAKMHDERENLRTGRDPQFYVQPAEPFTDEGRQAIRHRVEALFDEVKKRYELFRARDELTLSDRALAFIVGEIAPYSLMGPMLTSRALPTRNSSGPTCAETEASTSLLLPPSG